MAQFQGFTPTGSPHRSGSSEFNSRSPKYTPGVHSNLYIPTNGGSKRSSTISPGPPIGLVPYVVNSGVGNIVHSIISNSNNNNLVKKVYCK